MFVRSVGGISHSSLEHTSADDVAAATAALAQYLLVEVHRSAPDEVQKTVLVQQSSLEGSVNSHDEL